MFSFHPYSEKMSNLTNMFSDGLKPHTREPLSPFEVKLEVLADGLPLHAEVHVTSDGMCGV